MDFKVYLQKMRSPQFAYLGLLAASIVSLYWNPLGWLVQQWLHDKVYSHGFIVIPIAILMAWMKRQELAILERQPAYLTGGFLMLFAGVLLLVGRLGAIVQFEAVSLLVVLPGIILLVWGWKHVKALALPLFYLQFMVPWYDLFLGRIYPLFQVIGARIGSFLLRLLGYTVYRDGVLIHLQNITTRVAQECSGLNFLFSVMAVGLPLVYFTQTTWKRAFSVLGLGCVIAVLANGVRIALAGMMGNTFGPDMLHGPGHILRGWFVAQAGWVGIFIVNWLILKIPSQSKYRLFEKWRQNHPEDADARSIIPKKAITVVCSICIIFGVYINILAVPQTVELKQPLSFFPDVLGQWEGRQSRWVDGKRFFPGVDEELRRVYVSPSHGAVFVYVGYFKVQDGNKRLTSFHDKDLYRNARIAEIRIDDSKDMQVNFTHATINGVPYEAVFWYNLPSGSLANRYKVKLRTFFDSLIARRNNGAVIIIGKLADKDSSREKIPQEIIDFAKLFYNHLSAYLP